MGKKNRRRLSRRAFMYVISATSQLAGRTHYVLQDGIYVMPEVINRASGTKRYDDSRLRTAGMTALKQLFLTLWQYSYSLLLEKHVVRFPCSKLPLAKNLERTCLMIISS